MRVLRSHRRLHFPLPASVRGSDGVVVGGVDPVKTLSRQQVFTPVTADIKPSSDKKFFYRGSWNKGN